MWNPKLRVAPHGTWCRPDRRGCTMDGMPRPDRATFRLPAVALFVPALLFF